MRGGTFIFYAIGNCVLFHKSTACIDAQLRARNKSCADKSIGRESVRSTLLFYKSIDISVYAVYILIYTVNAQRGKICYWN